MDLRRDPAAGGLQYAAQPPELVVGAFLELFYDKRERVPRDWRKPGLFQRIEHVEVEGVFEGDVRRVGRNAPRGLPGEQGMGGPEAPVQIMVERDAPDGADGGLVVLPCVECHEQAVQIEEGGVHVQNMESIRSPARAAVRRDDSLMPSERWYCRR